MHVMRLAVLASGSGTILRAMLAENIPIHLVLTDRPCAALDIAKEARVEGSLVDRQEWGGFTPDFDRYGYSEAVTKTLIDHGIDLVAMAGFGTVLDEPLHQAFPSRVLNTHPSLLPDFPGWHSVEDALAAGAKETGCTVHIAALEVDSGPVLAQEKVPVLPGDTVATLHERIKEVERQLYPAVVRRFLADLEEPQRAVS